MFGEQNASYHQKIEKKMQIGNQSVHPLIVGPETAVWINSCHCCNGKSRTHCEHCVKHPGASGAILRLAQGHYHPQESNELHQNPEYNVLCRNIGEEERRAHYKRNKRHEE